MKTLYKNLYFFAVMLIIAACTDYTENFPVPPASSVAKFSFNSKNKLNVPDTIEFKNESIIPDEPSRIGTVSFIWDFGDGTTSTDKNPTHIFKIEGNYMVSLLLTTSGTNEKSTAANVIKLTKLVKGDTLLYQGFDDLTLIPDNWVLVNVDKRVPDNPNYATMADSAWIVVNSTSFGSKIALGNSFYNPEGAADDWMILPAVTLGADPILSWRAMSLTTSGNYPDSYQIYVSTTDQTRDGCLANGIVYRVNDESWSATATKPGQGIQSRKISLTRFANQKVYVAFRLSTPSPGGDRLGIDDILILNQ